jgi:hypothetical protein
VSLAEGSPRQPAPQFPAGIAVVRLQASPYRSYSSEGYGAGRFSVIVTRDVPTPEQFQIIAKWPSVDTEAALNSAWLPQKFESIDELRSVAAKMQADVLLVYTIDTTFALQGHVLAPDSSIKLGANAPAPLTIAAKASAAFVDVRTGYVYGHADAGASAEVAELPGSADALDGKRIEVEREALTQLLSTTAKATWTDLAQQYQ